MIFSAMETPQTRAEYEKRCFYFLHQRSTGKSKRRVGEGAREEIPFLPNGRIDLANIDQLTRLSINTTFHFHTHKDELLWGDEDGDIQPDSDQR